MKTAVLYITLVGILFAGLLAVLRIGEKIKAPVNVSGDWQIDKQFVETVRKCCTPIYFSHKTFNASIEQSGIHLTIIFNDELQTEMHGILENNKMIFNIF